MESEKSNTSSQEEQNNTNSSKGDETQLFEQLPIDNTPFTAVKMEEKWFLTMGKYRLSEQLASYEECETTAHDASWERIMQIMNIMIKESDEIAQLNASITTLQKIINL